jgi:lipoyl synthase
LTTVTACLTFTRQMKRTDNNTERIPKWFKVRIDTTDDFKKVKNLVDDNHLHTVCREASCPNVHECWGKFRTAAFMILGDICTRKCRFCDVAAGKPRRVDCGEPVRIAKSVKTMNLNHAFITMVTRDDLPDGGASIMAQTVREIRIKVPGCSTEVLCSDLMGKRDNIELIVESGPDITGHNIETVRRLTPGVRSRSDYERSLRFLETVKEINPRTITKSSMMLGLGETREEVLEAMDDLRMARVDMLNIGQYLQPSRTNLAVSRYWTPKEFSELKEEALLKGFIHCESGPLVRSSYHADEQIDKITK